MLSHILEHRSVETLCERLGGRTIEAPTSEKIVLGLRNQAIRAERTAGASHTELAGRWGLTRRQIINILHGQGDEPDPNEDLFGQQQLALGAPK